MLPVGSDIRRYNYRIWDNLQPFSKDKLLKAIAKLGVVTGEHNKVLSQNQNSIKSYEGREAKKIMG